MTPEKQRIAIAEFCGWQHKIHNNQLGWYTKDSVLLQAGSSDLIIDLNAMHEAEKKLSDYCGEFDGDDSQQEIYALNILKMVGYHKPKHWGEECVADFFRIANATASQRAEAFLKTIGKWEE